MKKLMLFLLVLTVTVSLFATGGAQQGQTQGTVQRVTTQVTPRPLPVSAQFDFGDPSWHPQSATYYWTNPSYPSQPPVSNRGGYPIVQQPVTIRVAHPYYVYVTDYYDNDLVRFMEQLTNVRIEWDLLPETNTMDRVTLMFASGENLPDVFHSVAFTTGDLITLGTAGLIIPVADIVAENSFYYQRLLDEIPVVTPSITMADGNIYSMASYGVNVANQLAMRFWINQPFLDVLGMQMPRTTEEYYNYLVGVRDRDVNQNGNLNDEIPFIAGNEGWHAHVDGFLMNSFIYNDTDTNLYSTPEARRRMIRDNNGRIDVTYNKPEWRQGVDYLRRLYAENLISSESFTTNRAGIVALIENPGAPIVGSLPSGGPHEFANTGGERRGHYRVLPPLRGPNGVQHAWYNEFLGVNLAMMVITKDAAMPDVLVKWADYMYTPDYQSRNRYGVLGRDWLIPPPGTPAVDGGNAVYEEILRWGTPQNAYIGRASGRTFIQSYNRALSPDPFELEAVLWHARGEYFPFRYQQNVPRMLPFTVEEAREFNNLNTVIVEYVEQTMAQWITGRLALNDANWNAYLQQINNLGLAQLLRVTQSAFDRSWAQVLGYR